MRARSWFTRQRVAALIFARLPGAGARSVFWQGVASTLASAGELSGESETVTVFAPEAAGRGRLARARCAERLRVAWERPGWAMWERHAEWPLRRCIEDRQALCEKCRLRLAAKCA